MAVFGLAGLAALSVPFDARIESVAQALPLDAVAWGRFVSDVVRLAPLYAASGLLTLAPLVLHGLRLFPARAASLRSMAERAGYTLATLSASGLASQALKHTVGRARPPFFSSLGPYHLKGFSADDGFASFPSGHATTAFAMATALSLLNPELRVALFTLAAAVATSRVVVQAHYASDIAAGAALGLTSALLVAAAFARWLPPSREVSRLCAGRRALTRP